MTDQKPMTLADVADYLEQQAKELSAHGGWACPTCRGYKTRPPWGPGVPVGLGDCPECAGTGKNPAITQAEAALAALRGEMERVERLRETAEVLTTDHINLLADWFDSDNARKGIVGSDVQTTLRRYARLRAQALAEHDAPPESEG